MFSNQRQERVTQGVADSSPARLTIAEASLLSLQGSQALPPKQVRRGGRAGNRVAGQHDDPVAYSPSNNRTTRNREQPVQNSPQLTKARNGYTPAEELILAVHAQQMQARGVPGVPGMNHAQNFNNFAQSPHITSPHVGHHNLVHDPYAGHETYGYGDEDVARRLTHGFEGLSMSGFQAQGTHQHARSAKYASMAGSYAHTNNNPPHNQNRNVRNPYSGNPRHSNDRGGAAEVPHHDHYSENENGGSPLFSPALTYSSLGRTPQTLSPATPYFGSFPLGEAFESFKGRDRTTATADEY